METQSYEDTTLQWYYSFISQIPFKQYSYLIISTFIP